MFFKNNRWGRVFLAMVLGFGLASCSLPINEAPPESETPETKIGFESKCLAEVLPTLDGFIDGSASPKAVSQVWDCFGGAIQLFYKKVRGSQRDEYSPREVAKFFEEYFFDGLKVSDGLLEQVMYLKQIFVGGSSTTLTKSELRKLMDFAVEARALSLELLPYMKVFSMKWSMQSRGTVARDVEYFEQANLKIQEVANRLGQRIADNGKPYRTLDLIHLLEEIQKLYGGQWDFLATAHKVLPLVHKLKKSLVGGQEDVIAAHEWKPFHILAARGYVQYLRYYYFITKAPDDAGPLDLIYITKSVDDFFSYLGDMVREKPGARLTRQELFELAQAVQKIFPQFQVTEALLVEVMKIKQLVFGGNVESWTPQEFDLARGKVDAFRLISQRIYAYLAFITQNWRPEDMTPDDADIYFLQGESNLIEIGKSLGMILETQYDLADVSKLAHELSPLMGSDSGETLGQIVDQYLPLILSIKGVLSADSSSIVMRSDWPMLLSQVGEFYGDYLYFHYFVRGKSISQGKGLSAFESLSKKIHYTLMGVLHHRAEKGKEVVLHGEVNRVLIGAHRADLLPKMLSPEVVTSVVPVLLDKLLNPATKRLSGELPGGISQTVLAYALSELEGWIGGQKVAAEVFRNTPTLSVAELRNVLNGFPKTSAIDEMLLTLAGPFPTVTAVDGRLRLSAKKVPFYDQHALEQVNLSRVIVRFLNNAAIGDLDRFNKRLGFTTDEANLLFKEVKPIFVQLGMLDESNNSFAESRAREANLFTPHADGSDLVSFAEGVDLVLFILSGLELDSLLKVSYEKDCRVYPGRAPTENRISARCYLGVVRKSLTSVFNSMPEMSEFLVGLKSGVNTSIEGPILDGEIKSFDRMFINLMKAAGWVEDGTGLAKISDLALVPHVMQYIESVMIRFDSDRDQFLNRPEAMNAFPVFRSILRTVADSNKDRILKGAFSYILVKGKAPETTKEKIYFIMIWVGSEDTWPIYADRMKLGTVLGYIADAMAKPKSQRGKDFEPPKEAPLYTGTIKTDF